MIASQITNIFHGKQFLSRYLTAVLLCGFVLSAVAVLWSSLPTTLSQYLFLALGAISLFAITLNEQKLSQLCVAFLIVAVAHRFQASRETSYYLLLAVTLLIAGSGLLIFAHSEDQRQNQPALWLIIGMVAAQTILVVSYWPVTFFSRTLISGIVFYFFWQLLLGERPPSLKAAIGQLVFIGLAVILVIGAVIWANYPHLIGL